MVETIRGIVIISLLLLINTTRAQRVIIYLHGQIVESQGPGAKDTVNGYGEYRYFDILDSLKGRGFTVLSEVRKKNTDPKDYAKKVVKQVDSLIKQGVPDSNITVVGASKGAVIAMLVSTLLSNNSVKYVFMGGCGSYLFTTYPEIKFHGEVLDVWEESDTDHSGPCDPIEIRAAPGEKYSIEILKTGLRHGFFYRPIREWLDPVTDHAKGEVNLGTQK